ncbi:MAG: CZB domain-containing protein [Candidatus Electrothrix sp. GW3-4]|uniref:CZB domain-containing protein n=1 Tax=Candidatus Electrothrix sp. GW3-4 TaxID=3126740 RepID=UPI0030CF5E8C
MDVAHIQVAIIGHLQWKSKLSDFFYGVGDLTLSQVPDHAECDFGKWLYSSGLQEFSGYQEMTSVESLHKSFHEKIKYLVKMPIEKRKSAEGKQALQNFKADCDTFIKLLETVQAKASKESI